MGILIVLTGIVLFVPVRYRGDFSVSGGEDGAEREISVRIRAFWFLRFFRVYVTRDKDFRVQMKCLFFTLKDTAKEQDGEQEGKKQKEKKGKDRAKDRAAEEEQNAKPAGAEDSGKTGERETKPSGDSTRAEGQAAEDEDTSEEKKGIDSIISKILQTIHHFCDKLKGIKEKAEKIEKLWVSERMVNSRTLLGKQLIYLLKHTKPKRLSGYLRFGFEDPSLTGYAMALYGILYPIWSPGLSVEPDFERQVLAFHVILKGKIRVWHIARVLLRLYLSKDMRRVIKDVRNF